MYYVKIIIIYVIVWWILFFMALPIGVSQAKDYIPGQDRGAPEKPKLWIKFLFVSVFAMIATVIINVYINSY